MLGMQTSIASVSQQSLDMCQVDSCHGMEDDCGSDCSTQPAGICRADREHPDDDSTDCSSDDSVLEEVESLLIFDWDDTLFPTTWMQQQGLLKEGALPNEEQWAYLHRMAECAIKTLRMSIQIGHTVIVTNAGQGWIELCCAAFFESVAPLLGEVRIVSARSDYEQLSQDPTVWKIHAFEREVETFYGPVADGRQRNIVSLGDSLHEQRALSSVIEGVSNCCGKSVKFLVAPVVDSLIEQHEFLHDCFFDIVEHNGDLDVEIGPNAFN